MSYVFIFILMLFLHITNDFYLQGDLKQMKQKLWWKENYPQSLYKYDYITSLIIHAFSWSFMVFIPVVFLGVGCTPFVIAIVINTFIHSIVDHVKANCLLISVTQDEICHIIQIIVTMIVLLSL